MHAVLFVGPSVFPEDVRSNFDGEVLPPIKRGDIPKLLSRPQPPQQIGIVDGQFLHYLAVSPKEVLRALRAGIQVYGSSSMGALRAVECAPFGMTGVGRIFELFFLGELEADDEVAITFEPESLRSLCEPLVNIRIAMNAAVANGLVDEESAALMVHTAKRMYFPDRSYANIRAATRDLISTEQHERLFRFLTSPDAPDQKRADALELIGAMQEVDLPRPATEDDFATLRPSSLEASIRGEGTT